ncbi:hypothetical protein TBLA_0C07060 [Henningerozyma blattae CBS 6284]|uniref:1,3-beta-glucan synthase n=1 Tax=Henningerozyma blattae (strain ATCC 34711 / CBS 6284 / DSM 70876 / NBRC 10599 / NRRL Y-10934 / UCD 77-7) TaxID=1071380 RepID=I2H295_HENB6|nr:hypothetical protein TBLA_0C07060 [Tetrapisispora blattae CBS 6284]CCH60497.1 hypothetical protein TBLA_0C07060 [Tetrapisispora blattae CBS 6284]
MESSINSPTSFSSTTINYPAWCVEDVPVNQDELKEIFQDLQNKFGFQVSSMENMYHHMMNQLDSRTSRTTPSSALNSLHMSYIGGDNANFKKWFLSTKIDIDDNIGFNELKLNVGSSNRRNKKFAKKRNSKLQKIEKVDEKLYNFNLNLNFNNYNNAISNSSSNNDSNFYFLLKHFGFYKNKNKNKNARDNFNKSMNYVWRFKMSNLTPYLMARQIALYLLIWGEANNLRFTPELLCFLFKCAWDYDVATSANNENYNNGDITSQNRGLPYEIKTEYTFLNDIISPIYNFLRGQLYNLDKDKNLTISKEIDHKHIIGYDDINQLFWYPEGIERIVLKEKDENNQVQRLIDKPLNQRYLYLKDVNWSKVFYKTYKEKRTWLHSITNFNRFWIIHLTSFWYFTSLNSPIIYTKNYYQLLDNPPLPQVKYTIISIGGTIACLIQIFATIFEWGFIPRQWPGAQHLKYRMFWLVICFLINFLPTLYILLRFGLSIYSHHAYYISIIQLIFSILISIFFAIRPLGGLFSSYLNKDFKKRRYNSSLVFTSSFPKLKGRSKFFSYSLWFLIFVAKFIESYFFLTLSLRDPIRVLYILDMSRCNGDRLIGNFLCQFQPIITLALMLLTDLALFFLDTYLWYIICNSLFSILLSFSLGTSILTPWKNIFSRLPQRIQSKLLSEDDMNYKLGSKTLVSHIWNAIIVSMYREHLLSIESTKPLLFLQRPTAPNSYKKSIDSPKFFIEHDDSTFKTNFFATTSEAERRISFFAQSLSTPIIQPSTVETMPTFTVLIPHYSEKILFSLNEIIKEESVNAKITILEYLRELYKNDWKNFIADTKLIYTKEDSSIDENFGIMSSSLPNNSNDMIRDNSIKGLDVTSNENVINGNINLQFGRGINNRRDRKVTRKVIRLNSNKTVTQSITETNVETKSSVNESFISNFKRSKDQSTSQLATEIDSSYNDEAKMVDELIQKKIDHLPYEVYGFKTSEDFYTLRTRVWASLRTQTLYRTVTGFMNYSKALKILYSIENSSIFETYHNDPEGLDTILDNIINRKFKMLIAMQRYTKFNPNEIEAIEILLRGYPYINISYLAEEKDEETNETYYYSCLTDGFQEVDLETNLRKPIYKIRLSGNPILGDGKSDNQNHSIIFYRGEYIQVVDANQDNYLEECFKIRSILNEFEESSIDRALDYIIPEEGAELEEVKLPPPVAIVGAREYIFSENIGVLGDIAAGKEQTFGTLFARTLAEIGGKLHYGHPDFINAIFMTTRGGLSKAQKSLHLNEDIYAGMNAICRGGRIKHSDYYQCGKGRDLGFSSILNFTTKIGAGMGEQLLSREYYYLGTQLPIDRFLSFFYAHPGFHLNNVFISLAVQLFFLFLINLGSLNYETITCNYDKNYPITSLEKPIGCYNIQPALNWVSIFVLSIFIVFFIAFAPLLILELLEKGIWKATTRFMHHLFSMAPLFEVFVCQVYSNSLLGNLTFGGAKYISTGRGFAIQRVSFPILYSRFVTVSIYSGIQVFIMLIFATITMWQPALLWFWITVVSMCFAPFIFNPHQFSFPEFFLDYRRFLIWLFSGNNKYKRESWATYVKHNRAKYTGYKKISIGDSSEKDIGNVKKPKFKNIFFMEIFAPFFIFMFNFTSYTFINAQTGVQDAELTHSIIRLLIVTFIPIVFNLVINICFIPISLFIILPFSLCIKGSNDITAFVPHILSVIIYLVDFEIMWYLQEWNFARTLILLITSINLQIFLFKTFTILFITREYKTNKTNMVWWSGKWKNTERGLSIRIIPIREFFIKLMESSYFAADFYLGHLLLYLQTPLIFVAFIDYWHSMTLYWLKPMNIFAPKKVFFKKEKSRRRRRIIGYFLLYFFILGIFITLLMIPLFINKVIPKQENILYRTMFASLMQPSKTDNNDTGVNAPLTILTTTPVTPTYKTVA